ncbi:MAG: hypothetical protein FWC10_05870 [Lentimicrobiaceae bacterium]|nr:hypothetical protein [Lentimicrobiaceae bacterium]MCL2246622.1 hypothetical protein [Lentimicrobiaceae bacterium]
MNTQQDDLKMIREMMEKSSKFLSLSGLSGVIAGVTAILGAGFAYFYLLRNPAMTNYTRMQEIMILLADASLVLIISLGVAIFLSKKKAAKTGQRLFNAMTLKVVYHFAVPLITGGLFALIFLFRGDLQIVISSTLIFYGLALVNASKFTYNEIHYLGITEILVGLLAVLLPHNNLILWTIGFGFCHIFYGTLMHFKYDRKK